MAAAAQPIRETDGPVQRERGECIPQRGDISDAVDLALPMRDGGLVALMPLSLADAFSHGGRGGDQTTPRQPLLRSFTAAEERDLSAISFGPGVLSCDEDSAVGVSGEPGDVDSRAGVALEVRTPLPLPQPLAVVEASLPAPAARSCRDVTAS